MQREALAFQLSALSRDDVPGDVVALAAVGKKIQAIKRYRQLTGVNLKDAREVINGLRLPRWTLRTA